ncbi:MAG TPA: FAD-binding domain-containing protein [Ferruginibacter sp.]|nr:FAD-binding domain-containing protein [Ferruginibacter sp.]HMP20824.1 FAD-binding domain-containing protein [Ferruginibacter sp.]
MFATEYSKILQLVEAVNPVKYGATRNYIDGAVTQLSPYISRGIISVKQVAQPVLSKGYNFYEIETFIKELAWREYFQQVWIAKGNDINGDLKQPQANVETHSIPATIINHNTGISAIDNAIKSLYATGYMHNHLRMYVASLTCNIARSHWLAPAQWLYYHLLDADWASNALSWQWVAGSFSSKKYYANQANINTFCYTSQHNTFLDTSYEHLQKMAIPEILTATTNLSLTSNLPKAVPCILDKHLPTCVYNFYNLDCNWLNDIEANRILLLEPSFFKQYPVSDNTIEFVLSLSKNIKKIQVFVGEFEDLALQVDAQKIHFKEHPANRHYTGTAHNRTWLFEAVSGYYPSFFKYWKNCEKQLRQIINSQPSAKNYIT